MALPTNFPFTILILVVLGNFSTFVNSQIDDSRDNANSPDKIPNVEEILISDDEEFYEKEELEESFPSSVNNASLAPLDNGDSVRFYLFTRDNPSSEYRIIIGDQENLRRSPFKSNFPVKILIHGFGGNHSHRYPSALKDAYLKTSKDVNVILVDWSVLAAAPFYDRAVFNTVPAGKQTSKLIQFLISSDATSVDRVHIIGHSLGGHVAGIAGNQVESQLGRKIARITGLDPARPAFEIASRKRSLDDSDAKFVDVIHTSILGLYRVVGHVDIYPNKGLFQPGCLHFDLSCSHARSHEMFTNALFSPKSLRACKCPMDNKNMVGHIPRIFPRRCVCNENDDSTIAFMGNMLERKRGVFYFTSGHRQQDPEQGAEMV